MKLIAGGEYKIGTNRPDGFLQDCEGPQILVQVTDFWIDETTVTNEEFAKFVTETGYVTDSERFGWSSVFAYFVSEKDKQRSIAQNPNWFAVRGANWRHPEGPEATLANRLDHPVVHVSRNDTLAYCQWANKRLPTEVEWEIAAKGGTTFERYPWGAEFLANNQHHCNIWQGKFPHENTQADGFLATAPVQSFEPNGYGLYQMIGNVWEWCVNPQKIALTEFQTKTGAEFWQKYQQVDDAAYGIRGGSFLCHASYCKRYRIAARNGNTGMSASNNMGFRCVRDVNLEL